MASNLSFATVFVCSANSPDIMIACRYHNKMLEKRQ
jgi:hypothetical protein